MRQLSRFFLLLAALMLFCASSLAEPQSLRECTTVQEASLFIDYPTSTDTGLSAAGITAGRIRYISQVSTSPYFMKQHWLGGTEGSSLDLTRTTDGKGKPYEYHAGTMCTRAVFSMAMSYMGIDLTPGGMSRLMKARYINEPYDSVTSLLGGLQRVENISHKQLDDMVDHFLEDPSYSPVMINLVRENKTTHSLLIIGRYDDGQYIVVDPAYYRINDAEQYVQLIQLGKSRWKILGATIKSYEGATIQTCFQWRYTPKENR